jgi:hypothetical protein
MRWCRKHCPGDVAEFFTSSGKRATGVSVHAAPDKKAKVMATVKAPTKPKTKTTAGAGKENSQPSSGPRGGKATGLGPKGKNAGTGGGRGKTYGRGLVVNMDGHAPALALQALVGIAASIQAGTGS